MRFRNHIIAVLLPLLLYPMTSNAIVGEVCRVYYSPDEVEKFRVSGTVIEAGTGNPLPLCTISVYNQKRKRTTQTKSLDDGSFSFQVREGEYELRIESTGHKTQRVSIKVLGGQQTLETIALEIGEELDAAGVEAKSLVNIHGTRVTYDVSRDPDAARISIMEMAARVPQLRMSAKNGRLEYESQKIGKILINEEESGLINARRQYPMEFIKADYLSKIELVMPGDGEYNNKEPIMLITLAKKLPYGAAANIEMKSDTKNNHSPSVDAVANTPLIGVGAGYAFTYAEPPSLTDEYIQEMADKTIEGFSTSRSQSNSHSFHANLFRAVSDDKLRASASFNASVAESSNYSESGTSVYSLSREQLKNSVTTSKGSSNTPFNFSGAVALSGDFGKVPEGMRSANFWNTSYSYSNSHNTNNQTYSDGNTQASGNGSEEHRLTAEVNLKAITVKPIRHSMLISGGYYNRHYTSSSSYLSSSESFDYRQQVGFMNVKLMGVGLKDKLSYNLRLKTEYLNNRGVFLTGDESIPLDWEEFNPIPEANVEWRFKRSSISLGYIMEVRRPTINQLNPYLDRRNPYYLRTGNPELSGEKNNSVTLGYLLRPSLKWLRSTNFHISWAGGNDAISQIVTTSPEGIATCTYANIGRKNSVSASVQAFVSPKKGLTMIINAAYTKTWVTIPGGAENSFHSPNIVANLNWKPKWFELNGNLRIHPSVNSVQSAKLILEPGCDLSISRYFAKPHLGLSLSVRDVFHSGGKRESVLYDTNFIRYDYTERVGRYFSFRIYWRIGQFKTTQSAPVKAYDM